MDDFENQKLKYDYHLTNWDKKSMAYHEAGHVVCHYILSDRKIIKITISPTNEAFGMMKIEENKNHNETESYLKNSIAILLGGRLSEELYLGQKTTSCYHDLQIATQIANDMVCRYGMGKKIKLITKDNYSEQLLFEIEKDIINILQDAENIAKDIIVNNQYIIHSLANFLLQHETLTENDINVFFRTTLVNGK